ncbi:unnamed protein product [Polarella glacialis]|uniref:Transmembrane protein n=1 Tax=Polarella glacialis TaxID=89957 RepID=A0A813L7W0_POLGL|nr:unnamed protein product [Polarella glacialis]CAE8618576.1 unnamed protein product [Polarella glacialis]CAE8718682.1 unnamed protein product [Polarella glacialis]
MDSDADGEWHDSVDGEGQGPQGPVNKMSSAFGMCCCGIFVFPMALLLLGYNEKRYVCESKNILYAESKADVMGCSNQSIREGVVYFSCDLDPASLQTFTPSSNFKSTGLGTAINFKSTAGAQTSSMWQCVESSKTETRNKQERTVFSYSQQWVSHQVDSSRFSTNQQATSARAQACPAFPNTGNPSWPADLSESTENDSAQSVKAGPFTISHTLLTGGYAGGLPIDLSRPIPLAEFSNNFQYKQSNQLPVALPIGFSNVNLQNTAVDGSSLVTCNPSKVIFGCMKIEYFKNWATHVSAVTSVDSTGFTSPIKSPASWGCSKSKFEALMPGALDFEEFLDSLHASNKMTTWLLRICGILAAWIGVFCCLKPISAAADIMGDCLNFIPCIGGFLEGMLEGIVDCILCFISCGFGVSSAFFVIAVVWVVMRPLIGAALLFASVLLCLCSAALIHQFRGDKTDQTQDETHDEKEMELVDNMS